jgi:Protein of unknown function (DUF732)
MNTRAALAAIAVGAALMGGATYGIGAAHADNEDSFLSDMEAAGFDNGNGNGAEIMVGYDICSEIAGGWSPTRAAHDLWKTSKLDKYGAKQFVGIAIRDLCPHTAGA